MKKELIFIDYENVQSISSIDITENVTLIIIVGVDQNKIPIDVVQKIQRYGDQIQWIKVKGRGKNALDFFIAFYLGMYVEKDSRLSFRIFSKDKGYDPLVHHLNEDGIDVSRIEKLLATVKEDEKKQNTKTGRSDYDKAIMNLQNMDIGKRPKKKEKLIGHVKNIYGNKKSEEVISKIIKQLFDSGFVILDDKGNIKYRD